MHAIPTLVKYTMPGDFSIEPEEVKDQPQDSSSWLPQFEPKYAPLTRDVWRTEHDDHWASVRSPETSVPIDRNPDPEKQPLARNYGHKYLMGETDKVDRGRNRSQVENEYPIDTNDAVVNAINRHPSSPYVQNQVIPPPAQAPHWRPTSRAQVPVSVRDKQLVLPFKSTLPYNLESDGVGIKVILGEAKWRKLKREVESIGGYNEQLDCCYSHALGRCTMYSCFPCFYCCLYKHNEEYTSQVYKYWRDEFEAKNIDFVIYYSPGSLWNAFVKDDFELAPATHCFCIDVSSPYVKGIYAKHAAGKSNNLLSMF